MEKMNYFQFVSWYYKANAIHFYKKEKYAKVGKRFRLCLIILCYIALLCSPTPLICSDYQLKYLVFIWLVLLPLIGLFISGFSFIVYFVVYLTYRKQYVSFNNELIFNSYVDSSKVIKDNFDISNLHERDVLAYLAYTVYKFEYKKHLVNITVKKNSIIINGKKVINGSVKDQEEFKNVINNYLTSLNF